MSASKEENTQVLFVKRPADRLDVAETFAIARQPMPTPADGQLLLRIIYLSIDPGTRSWMEDRRSYVSPLVLNEMMRGSGVAEVIESRCADYSVGDIVIASTGWQEYAAVDATLVSRLSVPEGIALPVAFAGLHIAGLTAYFGMLDIGQIKAGQTVVVSGAAGATGSIAVQIAKLHGCRVIGIAGGPDKCRHLTEVLGVDVALDYRATTFEEDLATATPAFVDVFYDNVGGDVLDAVLLRLAKCSRIVLCGGISQYDRAEARGPKNYLEIIKQSASMVGFVLYDYKSRYPEAAAALAQWIAEGKIKVCVDVQEGGVSKAPDALARLFSGKNIGKQLVRVGAEPGNQ
ncbi:zinc-binding dehydrogenase [Syncephalis pseudoplumigaleata]|uniref:Zinc-binding dehydrogenase n=1 Tax=Syncephalis pseudoplumigaleata TaxID=1712513 RepID=A0A4P9YUH9_9FUNG|nr:zinc-binding dehydrogenase [Syncephalis pseudoplumigaleata]|eukprot:RKP23445.1 zinc-binding dehydrogenase [Syncephalis pseudoplumigaleata]